MRYLSGIINKVSITFKIKMKKKQKVL